jgi:hypothetical protein
VTIEIVSGFQLPKVNGNSKGEIIDPYVVAELIGVVSKVSPYLSGTEGGSVKAKPEYVGSHGEGVKITPAYHIFKSTSVEPVTPSSVTTDQAISHANVFQKSIVTLLAKTATITDNGFNPKFNSTFVFRHLHLIPGLTFLKFTVWDEDRATKNELVASWSGLICRDPLVSSDSTEDTGEPEITLGRGYRQVALSNWKGEALRWGSLFVRISIEDDK